MVNPASSAPHDEVYCRVSCDPSRWHEMVPGGIPFLPGSWLGVSKPKPFIYESSARTRDFSREWKGGFLTSMGVISARMEPPLFIPW